MTLILSKSFNYINYCFHKNYSTYIILENYIFSKRFDIKVTNNNRSKISIEIIQCMVVSVQNVAFNNSQYYIHL